MLASLLLTFREGLEAALIVGIILSYLGQIGYRERRGWVWAAVGVATALSLALAAGLQIAGAELEGKAEAVFEGFAMFLAVGVLTWMIYWMRYQARFLKGALEADIRLAVRKSHNWGLFSMAFLAVFREGVETALFLTAASFVSDGLSTWIGGLIGLALAALVGWLIYSSTMRLNVRRFFNITSVLLLIFAAGLFAHGIHEFQEIGWLPVFGIEVWNLKSILSDESTVGAILRALVGYNDNPTLLELVGYLVYWGLAVFVVNWWVNRIATKRTVATHA
jgi:high-affinity iron transporter